MNLSWLQPRALALLATCCLIAACGDDFKESNNQNNTNNMSGDMASNNRPDMNTTTNNDNDMPTTQPECGNGVKEAGETCDGADCPTTCAPAACVTSTLVGAASTCDARCEAAPIAACQGGDGCCPTGCTIAVDSDCTPMDSCGNGTLDGGETCDGADCPTVATCQDNDACTIDSLVGNAAMCDAACLNEPILLCADGDGCCPIGCAGMDSDCADPGDGGVGSTCVDDTDCTAANATCLTSFDDGYCTSFFCQSDAECGGDNLCVQVDDQGTTACLDRCADANDCRPGYVCENLGAAGFDVCLPPIQAPSEPGTACASDADCGSGGNDACILEPEFVGGYCTTLFCQSDADCGGDGACLTVDQQGTTACIDTCDDVTDCRPGYDCIDVQGVLSICFPPQTPPTSTTGEPCAADTDCSTVSAAEQAFCLGEVATGWSDGYCSATCTTAADCGAGEVCQDGACVLGCVSDADCRTGYACQDYFGSGSAVCAPDTTSAPGATCAADSDCVGGIGGAACELSFPGGYCVSGCATDAGCPSGSICELDVCLDSCTTNADCRAGYECFAALGAARPFCAPVANGAGAVGASCATISDCAGGQLGGCLNDDQWSGGYCIQACSAQSACPSGSHCGFMDPMSGEGTCVKDCASDNDCRSAGYACYNGDMSGASECLPSATGAGAVGATCTALSDCAGGQDGFCISEASDPTFVGGYCSLDCTNSNICPAGGACVEVGANGEKICLDSCTSDAQCRNGYACLNVGADNICFPQ